ncbi:MULTISPECIES: hypothetical protein [unclassified Anabaena]|uniref:hypothetical protein n=1 Tax=unclassified Anabaena TaxID=2619674 RepID=UPI001447B619|nr:MULTISPECIES: hypothetical protein [unclassified Anabaena]MTJ07851.1 hypothetical protein [Anabaena sp. UHCC 0204]MTJ51647.1 hypothetical protein [Anabaena sp. UHCC 0253]
MKTAEKLAAGWLLTLGFMFLAISVSEIIDKSAQSGVKVYPVEGEQIFSSPNPAQTSKDAIVGGIIFGVPSAILGSWLALSLYQQNRKDKQVLKQQNNEQLRSQFYQTLQQNQGRVTLLNFAMQSQLPAAEAKKYLDEKAKEFNANFQVTEEGAVSYHFDV